MCLSTGLPIPGSNTDGDLYDVDIYDIDYSYSSSVIADLQSKGKGSMFPAASNRSPCMYHALQFFFFRVHPVVFRRGITYRVRAGASRVPPAVFLKFQFSIIGSTPMHVLVMPNGLIGPIGLDVNLSLIHI